MIMHIMGAKFGSAEFPHLELEVAYIMAEFPLVEFIMLVSAPLRNLTLYTGHLFDVQPQPSRVP